MTSEYLLFNWQVGGEPNNAAASNGEHCLEMRKGRQGFFWNDNNCKSGYIFYSLCEKYAIPLWDCSRFLTGSIIWVALSQELHVEIHYLYRHKVNHAHGG